jgi:hypothetical protein
MTELPQERLLVGEMSLASAEAAYEWTRTWVKERKAFGSTLSSLQTIKHRLATIKTEICVARSFTDHCLMLHKNGRLDSTTASMVKCHLTELQGKVIHLTFIICFCYVLFLYACKNNEEIILCAYSPVLLCRTIYFMGAIKIVKYKSYLTSML